MSELKPCPFCGGVAQVNTWTMHGITESRCFCSNSDCPNSVRTVALEQWNTRPIEDVLHARIAELEAENAELKERVAMLDVTAVFKSLGEMGYIEQVDKLIASNTKLEEFVNELIETRRIRIVSNGGLPQAKESVLALVKSKWSGELYIERACYIPPKSVRADDFFLDELEDESAEEYDEELDLYWVAEGWWEDSHEANVNWKISGEVIGWWKLPKIEELEAETKVQE